MGESRRSEKERKIFFHFIGDSQGVKFENGKGEVTIPKGSTEGTIKLFTGRSVSNLKIMAESWNGLRDKITSAAEGVRITFYFPWIQLLCALVGGLVFPLLWQAGSKGLGKRSCNRWGFLWPGTLRCDPFNSSKTRFRLGCCGQTSNRKFLCIFHFGFFR